MTADAKTTLKILLIIGLCIIFFMMGAWFGGKDKKCVNGAFLNYNNITYCGLESEPNLIN